MTSYVFFAGSRVGADPHLTNAQSWLDLETFLEKYDLNLVSIPTHLVDLLWTEETGRPPFVVRFCSFLITFTK